MVNNNVPIDGEISFTRLNTEFEERKKYVVLIECGAFSPITNMHLRIMEDAKNSMEENGYQVMGGFMSPVHPRYGKKTLAPPKDRYVMVELALESSTWISATSWEINQNDWTATAQLLNMFSKHINNVLYPGNHPHIEVRLVCGSDIIYTFDKLNPDGSPIWTNEDLEIILGKHGLVCIEREKFYGSYIIEINPMIKKHKDHVQFVTPHTMNTISSTNIRKLIREKKSIKYLVPDSVERYIRDHRLNELPEWNLSN